MGAGSCRNAGPHRTGSRPLSQETSSQEKTPAQDVHARNVFCRQRPEGKVCQADLCGGVRSEERMINEMIRSGRGGKISISEPGCEGEQTAATTGAVGGISSWLGGTAGGDGHFGVGFNHFPLTNSLNAAKGPDGSRQGGFERQGHVRSGFHAWWHPCYRRIAINKRGRPSQSCQRM